MKKCLISIAFALISITSSYTYGQEPPEKPKVIREILTPELYEMTITLSDGETIKLTKFSLTKKSLEKRIVFRVLDHTIRVIPDGEKEIRIIKSSQIEKVEIVKVKDKDKDKDEPKPIPTLEPIVK
jgi:hypothetical protein